MQDLTTMTPDEVKAARALLGLSQTDFGKAVGAGLSTVQAWEGGTRQPLPMLRLAIAALVKKLKPWHPA